MMKTQKPTLVLLLGLSLFGLSLIADAHSVHAGSAYQAGQTNAAAVPPGWYRFKSTPGKFTAYFPSAPAYKTQALQVATLQLMQHSHRTFSNQGYFEVSYFDLPPVGLDTDALLSGFMNAGSRYLLDKGGKLTLNQTVEHRGCTGREVIVTGPGDSFTQMRVFMSRERVYMLLFGGLSDNARTRSLAKSFLESFAVEGGCVEEVSPVEAPSGEVKRDTVEGVVDRATGWRLISSTKDGFSVLLPTAAAYEEEQSQVKPIPLTARNYSSESDASIYLATVVGDYPEGVFISDIAYQVAFDTAIEEFKKKLQGQGADVKLIRNLKVGTYPGREYSITAGGQVGQAQLFGTPRRLYFFMAFGAARGNYLEDFKRFFSSIKLSTR